MTREQALLDAAITVQVWRRLPRYERERVRRHVARALRCPPFLVGNRGGNCGAADGASGLRFGEEAATVTAQINNPPKRRAAYPARAGEILSCGNTRFPYIAGFCKPYLGPRSTCVRMPPFRAGCAATLGRE